MLNTTYLQNRALYIKRLSLLNSRGKDQTYTVLDGIIRYKVTLHPQCQCQCQNSIESRSCCHILYLLFEHFCLSELILRYLFEIPQLYDLFLIKVSEGEDLNPQLEKFIDEYFSGQTCGICSDNLNHPRYQYQFQRCNICHQYTHLNCYQKWQTRKKAEVTCIYCGLKTAS